jgi:low temperature requirement protein LtrA
VSESSAAAERRVSSVELFLDLVFVFAFTQVTTLWLDQVSWGGLGRGALVLLALWWVWASFAWLTNTADVERDLVLGVMVFAAAALFVAALAVPDAFGTHRLTFGVAFLVVVVAFVGLYVAVSMDEPDQFRAVRRMSYTVVPGVALVLAAAFAPTDVRPALWAVAFVVGFFGPNLGGLRGWRVNPAHFAERHGLILIIAIGESLGAIGFGARETRLTAGVIAAAVLGLLVAASFWLAYFDFASGGLEHLLSQRRGEERVAFARDAYTYLHLPMVAGVLLFAFAMRTTLAHVDVHLHLIPALAMCCGSAIYLLAFVALRWRATRALGHGRLVAAIAVALLTPLAVAVPALVALATVAGVWIALHAYELIWWRAERLLRRGRSVGDGAGDITGGEASGPRTREARRVR